MRGLNVFADKTIDAIRLDRHLQDMMKARWKVEDAPGTHYHSPLTETGDHEHTNSYRICAGSATVSLLSDWPRRPWISVNNNTGGAHIQPYNAEIPGRGAGGGGVEETRRTKQGVQTVLLGRTGPVWVKVVLQPQSGRRGAPNQSSVTSAARGNLWSRFCLIYTISS